MTRCRSAVPPRAVRLLASVLGALCGAIALPGTPMAQQQPAARDTTQRTARDTVPQQLAPVVTVTRERARSLLDVPLAISTTEPDSMRPGQIHTDFDETLLLLPGVTVANRDNPTQDPRISIRGFGARSAFGVRNVRILRDGMPLTLADGSTPVDYLDLESVGRVEVIRGSAASLYGNASGGVIDVRTEAAPLDPFSGQARMWVGGNGLQRWTGSFGGTDGPARFLGDLNYTEQTGWRQYARQRVTSGYGKGTWTSGANHFELQVLGYDMPLADNPGALTQAQLDTAPTMADPFSVLKKARKTVSQWQVGLSGRREVLGGELTANVYGGTRDLFNPLTYAIVGVTRVSYGSGVRLTAPARFFGLDHMVTVGVDASWQNDFRKNWDNCNGVTTPTASCPGGTEQGDLTLSERELVQGVGPYVRDEFAFADRYRLSLGLREDYVRFQVKDRLVTATNPDESGTRTMSALSPMVGLNVRLSPYHAIYGNVSTAFETPTTTELVNQPSGLGGLNPDLNPEHTTTYEVGAKGILVDHVQYDAALFDTEVRDELIPFAVPDGSGRTYYRNAGKTRRQGVELGLTALVGPMELGASYSYSRFRFRDFVVDSVNYAGNAIPGIPEHQLQLAATWRAHGAFVTAESITKSSVWVDDGNTASAAAFTVANLRAGATAAFGRPWLAPVVGVSNLFDRTYAGSVAINAARGKYFEPSPGRTFFVGLTLAAGH